jgi:competence protein ComEC
MPSSALGFVAGTCLMLLLPQLPSAGALAGLAVAALVVGWRAGSFVPIALIAGVILGRAEAGSRMADQLDPDLEGRILAIEGQVASVPQTLAQGLRFRFEPARGPGRQLPRTIELTWYEPDWRPLPAERLVLEVKLRRPRGFANPGGSDYVARMLREGVGATGYIRGATRRGRTADDVFASPVLVARGEVARVIADVLGRRPATGIVAGLAVGLQDALSPEQWRALARSGTTHLMAISGMHIGMVAAIAAWLGAAVQRARQRRGALGTARDAALVCGVAAAVGYAALAGWSVPTQRTALMIVLLAIVFRSRRRAGVWHGVAVAAAAVLLTDPLSALAPGFWLSFGAVAAIVFATTGRAGPPGVLRDYGRLQLAVSVGLVPVLIGSFGGISLVSILVNLLAVPLYTLLIVPAVLVASALAMAAQPLGAPLLHGVAWLIETTWPLIDIPGSWSWAVWNVAALPLTLWCTLIVATIGALSPVPAPGRAAACIVLVAVAGWRPASLPEGAARIAMLDVGQGLSVVVETRNRVLVYDAGPSFRSGSDAALLAIEPYLRRRGVRAIDLLVVSHDDADHAGGAASLIASFPVHARAASGGALGATGVIRCARGGRWSWDGVDFEWLHPGATLQLRDNDRSCVLSIRAGEHRALLTGDIELDGERELLRASSPGAVDLLVVPHHGSRSSSGPELIDATRPRWALISSGHGNRWGLPAPEVVAAWERAGSRVLVTSRTGAVEFELRAGAPIGEPRLARVDTARFWQRSQN